MNTKQVWTVSFFFIIILVTSSEGESAHQQKHILGLVETGPAPQGYY